MEVENGENSCQLKQKKTFIVTKDALLWVHNHNRWTVWNMRLGWVVLSAIQTLLSCTNTCSCVADKRCMPGPTFVYLSMLMRSKGSSHNINSTTDMIWFGFWLDENLKDDPYIYQFIKKKWPICVLNLPYWGQNLTIILS